MPTVGDIEAALEEIGARLSADCSFTHFGGCNMTMQGIKDATQDVDVILEPPKRFGRLVDDLDGLYDWLTHNPVKEAYTAPRFAGVLVDWEVLDGPITIDLFPPGRIFNMLMCGPELLRRRRLRSRTGRLTVYQMDVTATFMLKAITGRWHHHADRDLEDLRDILTKRGHELDWSFLQAEWDRQMESCPDPDRAQTHAQEAVDHLRVQGFRVEWDPRAGP